MFPRKLAELDLHRVWSTAPDLDGTFDPFRFEHRMAAYRSMIDATNERGIFGPDNSGNLLWGLAFQHQWQLDSGRLGPSSKDHGRIDPDSPWGYGNYTLNVIPWLGAVAASVVPAAAVSDPPGPSRFRYVVGGVVPAELRPAVDDWATYFKRVRATAPGTDLDPLRKVLWHAHKTSLDVVARTVGEVDPAGDPAMELDFLRGWCRMVDYLWAACWPTDFEFMVEHGLDVLPEHVLRDRADLKALPESVRSNVANVRGLAKMPTRQFEVNLWFWRRLMRTKAARAEVLTMLGAVFDRKNTSPTVYPRMLWYLMRP
ncbi:Leg1-related protein [Smaragdicoccus niigatensis]|uniref:Leg1-related protein n=1 Tax=Smaragdicoccus niigatensis TaxID=359359 RepID=UPI0003669BED|nr:Leg1-related protein [Smaragdicoccus niigatensis]